ncbi:MAG: serine/threonine protein kinase [Rubrivivax sp.]|nr:serine/threonine protein kinase [Rubrivivax sp.]
MSDAARALPEAESALPPGTRLAEFEIRGLLGGGGFGIVYLAFDHALEREVAIKEYMPASMAGRTETMHVSLRSQSDAEVFALGLRSFVNEAKLLARFDHPSLIKVHRFWEANGTAYMAMPVLRGQTLKDIRRTTGRGPDEAWIRSVLGQLLGALERLHNEGVYHRDIAPDNIHLETDGGQGRPVLLDFGAARRVISGKTQTLTAILKPAYAPIEQYAETSAVKQGPWTDLYALGATMHFMLLGHPPPPATARAVADESSGLAAMPLPGCSPQLLATIDWMLAPKPDDRPRSVAELRAVLDGRAPLPHRPHVHRAAGPGGGGLPPSPVDAPVTVPLGDIAPADIEFDLGTLPPQHPRGAEPVRDARTGRERPFAPAHGEHPPLAADATHRVTPPREHSPLPALAALVVVAAGALGYFGWTRFAASGSQAVGAAAASAPASAVPAATTADPPAAATPSAGGGPVGAAPAPAGPVVPAAAGAQTGSPTGSSTASAPGEPPAQAAGAGGSADGASSAGRDAGPAAALPPARPAPMMGTAPVPAPAAATTPATGPGARGPTATAPAAPLPPLAPSLACAGRTPVSYHFCMERECLRPRLQNHADCRAWRQQARPRQDVPN